MKLFLITLCVGICMSIPVQSQNLPVEGTYVNTWKSSEKAGLTYTLSLHKDGTFTFESRRTYDSDYPDKIETASGTWSQKSRLVILKTDTSSDEDFVKDLNNTRAKFISLSPRHRKFNSVKPSLKFYESAVFEAKGIKLIKESDAVTDVTG